MMSATKVAVIPEARSLTVRKVLMAQTIMLMHGMFLNPKWRRDRTELRAKTAKAYTHEKSRADYMEFKGRGHYICGEPQWEEVAGYIAHWIEGK